jgi:hypothetical protein
LHSSASDRCSIPCGKEQSLSPTPRPYHLPHACPLKVPNASSGQGLAVCWRDPANAEPSSGARRRALGRVIRDARSSPKEEGPELRQPRCLYATASGLSSLWRPTCRSRSSRTCSRRRSRRRGVLGSPPRIALRRNPKCRIVQGMTYAVGQTIEVCLEFDLPPTRGIRRIVGIFVNERGKVMELTDVPARMSECVLQEPSQTALQGRAAYPGIYEMRQLKVVHLQGVSYINPPEISFEVKGTPEVAGWHLA